MTKEAAKIIGCVQEMRQRYGINVVAGTLAGETRAKLQEYRFPQAVLCDAVAAHGPKTVLIPLPHDSQLLLTHLPILPLALQKIPVDYHILGGVDLTGKISILGWSIRERRRIMYGIM